ncbi:MAG: hypothetical protein CMN05_13500 [Roseibacillus sp.]|jgi:hypothetical protein|nr:hypothetical protein [Roseibacillus sp.]|tara:strand:- start:3264 stop:4634 length:1371 start_codon:yes stop_codon:yes gene_type:complete
MNHKGDPESMTNQGAFQMNRRAMLRAAGITMALPWMESLMGAEVKSPPRRFCSIYFPYGVSLPRQDGEYGQWNWFPKGSGRDFTFNKSLEVLEPFRDQVTILGGLSHPRVRRIGGHDSGDTFLTGEELSLAATGLRNSISLDQFMARRHRLGASTRFTSLTLSSDGGVGMPTRANTLSYSHTGQPIPSFNRPAIVFERLFGLKGDSIEAQRKGLTRAGSHLDLLLDEAKSLHRKLGKADQGKLDQYLTSVREIEQDVERSAQWLNVTRPKVNAEGLDLDADNETPGKLIHTMLDLIALAFQTDSTRFVTYQLASMHGAISIANKFPSLLGFNNNAHGLAHGAGKGKGAENKGKWDRYQAECLAYLMKRLSELEEGEGSVLDNTCILYGSSNSKTHNNTNYPLILAGGKKMGYRHGQYLTFDSKTPLANLFVTMQKRMGVKAESFADSTGNIDDLIS